MVTKENYQPIKGTQISLTDKFYNAIVWLDPYRMNVILPLIIILLSGILFFSSLRSMDIRDITDIGLISVMPIQFFASLVLLIGSFFYSLFQSKYFPVIIFLHLLLLIFILFGITAMIEEVPRFNVTWRHIGIIDYIIENQGVGPSWDVYFGWPGLFIFNAFPVLLSGLQEPLNFVSWSPVFLNLLYLGPLLLIFRSVTKDQRLVWSAVLFFYISNWIGQDYFSPQGFAYFFYLLILGILLTWFGKPTTIEWIENLSYRWSFFSGLSEEVQESMMPPKPEASPGQKIGLFFIILVSFFYLTTSHPLTPMAIFLSLIALTLFKRVSVQGLVIIMFVAIVAWMGYVGKDYIGNNIEKILAGIGQVDAAVDENFTGRLVGSPGHVLVVQLRMVMTLVLWGLAGLGIIMRIRKGIWDINLLLITIAPFSLLGLQLYGGEMLLRAYLFALPPMVFFAVSLFFPKKDKPLTWITPVFLTLASFIMLSGFLFTRYGNEKFDMFTREEVAAVQALYELAEPKVLFVAPSPHYPIKFEEYADHPQLFVANEVIGGDVDKLGEAIQNRDSKGGYFIITTSQVSYFELNYNIKPESWVELEQNLNKSEQFQLVYENDDARIYHFIPKN